MTMSNRIAVIRHGAIEQIGPPEEVYESPATQFVAGFLGASNMLDGEVKESGNGTSSVLTAAGDVLHVPSDRAPFSEGTKVKVGVRPEKLSITAEQDQPAAGTNSVTGVLRMSTYIGVSHQYKVEGPGGVELTVYVQNLGEITPPQPGDRVRLSWLREHTFAVLPQEDLALEEEEAV